MFRLSECRERRSDLGVNCAAAAIRLEGGSLDTLPTCTQIAHDAVRVVDLGERLKKAEHATRRSGPDRRTGVRSVMVAIGLQSTIFGVERGAALRAKNPWGCWRAGEGTRTPTGLCPPGPKPGASTNSATPADFAQYSTTQPGDRLISCVGSLRSKHHVGRPGLEPGTCGLRVRCSAG